MFLCAFYIFLQTIQYSGLSLESFQLEFLRIINAYSLQYPYNQELMYNENKYILFLFQLYMR